MKKTDANGVAPEALEGAYFATGSGSGAAEVEKLGFTPPLEARQARLMKLAA